MVKCDKKYEQIVFNLLGRTLIVENMDTAIQMAKLNSYSFRIVTLEGDIISNTGAITGGSIQTKTVNILGRSREIEDLEKALKEINEKIEKTTKAKDEYTDSASDVIEEVTRLEKELQDIEVTYAAENQKMINIEEDIAKLEARREKLKKEGISFYSETDTEVVAALINKYYEKSPIDAITKALQEVKGSYALGILFEDNEDLYAVRKDSPLIVGIGQKENFIASDIAAIIDYTNKYILLEEKEIAHITKDKVEVIKEGKVIDKKIEQTNLEKDSKDKNGYDHYMLKEIMEEPVVLEKTFKPYLEHLDRLPDLTKYEEIHIVACGSAMYAGMIGKTLLEEYANTKVEIDVASEYRYKNIIYDRKTIVILISQSGETADTIAAMRKAKENKVETLAIVNVKTSTLARESDNQIFIEAGPEIAVATTKAYILQVGIMALLAYKTALTKGLVKEEHKVLEEAEKFIIRNLKDAIEKSTEHVGMKDHKTVLQEKLQENGDVSIKYTVIKETGPDHDKTFTVKVEADGKELAIGEGRTKKAAEMDAAGKALEKLK